METVKKNDSELFLDYMISNGFNPKNYSGILELFRSANDSLSRYLRDYNQLLLSRNVVYDDIDMLGINGAYGNLNELGEIFIPKTFANDERFLFGVRSPFRRLNYDVPSINEFGVIIGRTTPLALRDPMSQELFYSLYNNIMMDKFFGFCTDSDVAEKLMTPYSIFVEQINRALGKDIYTFEHDTISSRGKDLCLIKRSNK